MFDILTAANILTAVIQLIFLQQLAELLTYSSAAAGGSQHHSAHLPEIRDIFHLWPAMLRWLGILICSVSCGMGILQMAWAKHPQTQDFCWKTVQTQLLSWGLLLEEDDRRDFFQDNDPYDRGMCWWSGRASIGVFRKVSFTGGMENELPQKWVSRAQLRQGGLGRAGFSRQFASGGKATAKGLGTLRGAWETLEYSQVEIRKCPQVHQ